ncbi:hypothetical protein JCM10908_005979 [Rhodotorula pacifica]|uniref:uncharacterized protein n=1 Tax=Rhodotorula pacifica TaxID=1495444 RepID=UPI00317213CF
MYRDKDTDEIELHSSVVHVMPWITAGLTVVLAVGSFWSWTASKDTLPSYLQGPALIGGIFCCLAGIACIVSFFYITKGENHWNKDKHRNATDRNSHVHPLEGWPHTLVFGTTMMATLTEGSYLYMILCILLSKGTSEYCLTFGTTSNKDKCSEGKGLPWVIILILLLGITIGCALWFELAMQSSIARFNKIRGPLRKGASQRSGLFGGILGGNSADREDSTGYDLTGRGEKDQVDPYDSLDPPSYNNRV